MSEVSLIVTDENKDILNHSLNTAGLPYGTKIKVKRGDRITIDDSIDETLMELRENAIKRDTERAAPIINRPFTYQAEIARVYDGDTATVDFTLLQQELDLGFHIEMYQVIKFKKQTLRFDSIDTPELRGEEREMGLIVRDYVRSLIDDRKVIIESLKDKTGKYGRFVTITHFLDYEKGEFINLNDHLVEIGMAVEKNY